jgi:cell division protein FtsB
MRNRLTIALMLALLLGLQGVLWLGGHGLAELWRMERTLQGQQQQNERLKQRNEKLQADVLDLKHGSEGLEERARSQLGMIKPGETFYQVVEEPPEGAR